jgi:hypothetical protein
VVLIVASAGLIACGGEEEETRGFERLPDSGTSEPDSGTSEPDSGTTTPDAGSDNDASGQTDAGGGDGCDLGSPNPGPINGVWEVVTVPSETVWFELRVCHDLDDTNMDGSNFEGSFVETATGISGDLQNPSYTAEPLSFGVNWFILEDGEEFQFNFSQGTAVDEDTLSGIFLNGRILETGEAQLRRVQ